MNLIPFAVVWVVLAMAVIAIVVFRRRVARAEEGSLHVLNAAAVSEQAAVGQRLEQIDRWGKLLTLVLVLYGLVLAAVFVYRSFTYASTNPLG